MDKHPTTAQLSSALENVLREREGKAYAALNKGQKAFLSSWLLTLSGYMTGAAEEKRRLNGEIPMRSIPPASSQVRTGLFEGELYSAMLNNPDLTPAQVRSITNPDEIIFTAHPNFSERTELVELGQKILRTFVDKAQPDELADMARGDSKAVMVMQRLLQHTDMGANLHKVLTSKSLEPRTARTRADELYEATVNYIPSVLESGIEEVATMLKRAKNIDTKLVPNNLNVQQLDNFSAATSTHGTWFTDGDGKRTSRAWDNEFAIAAIKHKSLVTQLEYLNAAAHDLPRDHPLKTQAKTLAEDLAKDIGIISQIEEAAKERMLALTKLQTEHEKNPTLAREDKNFAGYRDKALKASSKYRALIVQHGDLLAEDDSAKVLAMATAMKTAEAKDGIAFKRYASKLDAETPLKSVDALYLAARKGDFPIKLERRENANQYKETIRHFLESSQVKDAVLHYAGKPANLDSVVYHGAVSKNDTALLIVLETISDMLNSEKDKAPDQREMTGLLKKELTAYYKKYARRIEPENAHEANPPPERIPVASEITVEGGLLLDDVSNLWISNLYPQAFKRTVIAEAATPDLDTLRGFGNDEGNNEITKGALLRGKSDMLTVNILRRLTGATIEETSLYEDPHAIVNTPALLGEILKDSRYHHAMGIDLANAGDRQMMKLDDNGKPAPMTAYDFMRQRGFDDNAMVGHSLDIGKLKKALVYVGPATMLANSDSAKRGTLATSTLNDVSIRECYITSCKNLLSNDRHDYMFVNPTYLGQGGTLGRTTGVTLFAPIYTEQGSHPHYKNGIYAAVEKVNRMLARLAESYNINKDIGLTDEGLERVTKETMPLGNPHALRNASIEPEKTMAMDAVEARIRATRDDREVVVDGDKITFKPKGFADEDKISTRYETMLSRYGIAGMSNYSARPKSKSSKDDFINTRAIGLNAKEFGIWSVIMGMSEMFDFDGAGAVNNINKMVQYYTKDQTGQHNFTAAIFTLNMFDETIERKWKQGGVSMTRSATSGVTLEKNGKKTTLAELESAYQNHVENHKGFDLADMAFAHIHHQADKLLAGIAQVKQSIAGGKVRGGKYGTTSPQMRVDPLSLVPDHLRDTVREYRQRVSQIYEAIEEVRAIPQDKREEKDNLSLRMALDAHYVLLEAGPPAVSAIELLKPSQTVKR